MFMTAKQRVASLFLEDVTHFLDGGAVRYSPNIEFTGRSGFVHKYDFVIPDQGPSRSASSAQSTTHHARRGDVHDILLDRH